MTNNSISKDKTIELLHRFMKLFKIDQFTVHSSDNRLIKAQVGWPSELDVPDDPEDDIQDIEWDLDECSIPEDSLIIAESVFKAGKIDIDKLCIGLDDFVAQEERSQSDIDQFILDQLANFAPPNWDKERTEKAIDELFKIKVHMIDDGEKTDYFFLHC